MAVISPEALAGLRADMLPMGVGIFLTGLALVVGALSLLRWREGDRSLLFFALFTGIYGVRIATDNDWARLLLGFSETGAELFEAVLSYLLPVPFALFFEQMVGSGWKRSLRRIWQLQLLFALGAVAYEVARGEPWALGGPYRVLVLLALLVILIHVYRPGQPLSTDLRRLRLAGLVLGLFVVNENLEDLGIFPWELNAEWIGFLIFLGILGWVAARRTFDTQRRFTAIQQELETARRIQASILPGEPPRVPGLDVAMRYVPAADVAGDFYDFLPGEGRRLGVVVADVSGHGVPAALIASMVKVAVAAQAPHAASPGRVLSEMSRIFHGKLKNQFITAVYAWIDLEAGSLTWASAGHPPPLLWRARDGRIGELVQSGVVLGRLGRAEYREASVTLGPGDRLLFFTDGIPEALDRSGNPFGDARLQDLMASRATLAADPLASAVLDEVSRWTGGNRGFEDDLTLVVVGIAPQ
ncbi:MAG TPA: PP2C family protein-serine/threonine phosphatase [Thermoanaerobaculia bacterium]